MNTFLVVYKYTFQKNIPSVQGSAEKLTKTLDETEEVLFMIK